MPQIIKDCLEQYILIVMTEITRTIKFDQMQTRTTQNVEDFQKEKSELFRIMKSVFEF